MGRGNMQNKKALCLLGVFIAGGLLTVHVHAAIEQNVTQPIGTLVRTWDISGPLPLAIQPPVPVGSPGPWPLSTPIEEVNYITAQWDDQEVPSTPPFDIHYPASEIILTEQ